MQRFIYMFEIVLLGGKDEKTAVSM